MLILVSLGGKKFSPQRHKGTKMELGTWNGQCRLRPEADEFAGLGSFTWRLGYRRI